MRPAPISVLSLLLPALSLATLAACGESTPPSACTPASERCDGLDNDCDGLIDEGFDLGAACTRGQGVCASSGKTVCSPDGSGTACAAPEPAIPGTELCDGLDNDCDGLIDEGFDLGATCTTGQGECTVAGRKVCASDHAHAVCDAVAKSPADERCDGLDNDCDGLTDDGFDLGTACALGVGQCATQGVTICAPNGLEICDATPGQPVGEFCDGRDNDCDGQTDNGFDLGAPCTVGVGQCAATGIKTCAQDGLGSVCSATPGPSAAESCDGLDNDCDGLTDDGFGLGAPCTVGVGQCAATGIQICAPDGLGSVCSATPGQSAAESCDGRDNDCDGQTDNGFGLGAPCTVGVGQCAATGIQICALDDLGSVCSATPGQSAAESCDGLDNDCDGLTDNGFGLGAACTVGVGQCATSGIRICSQDGLGSVCDATPGQPSDESCDGLDDDCDGDTDNGFDVGAACHVGLGECAASGTKVCTSDLLATRCSAVAGTPSAESCDGRDNDCDGAADPESATGCTPYFTDVDGDTYGTGPSRCLCVPDGNYRALRAGDCDDTRPEVNPGAAEVCGNLLDDDCDSATDIVADLDGDGWSRCEGDCCEVAGACGTVPAQVNPGACEVRGNGFDDDCNPSTSDQEAPPLCTAPPQFSGVTGALAAAGMDLCQWSSTRKWGLLSAELRAADGTVSGSTLSDLQVAVLDGFGTQTVPQYGPSMTGLSTGRMRDAADPGFSLPYPGTNLGRSISFPGAGPLAGYLAAHAGGLPASRCGATVCPVGTGAHDSVLLRLVILTPTNARGFSFDHRFYSADFTEDPCTQMNDRYLVLLSSQAPGIPTDKNIAFGAGGLPITVNSELMQVCSSSGLCSVCSRGANDLAGTGFDTTGGAATPWLTTTAPVVGGEVITLEFILMDVTDRISDTSVLVDNFHWVFREPTVQTTVN